MAKNRAHEPDESLPDAEPLAPTGTSRLLQLLATQSPDAAERFLSGNMSVEEEQEALKPPLPIQFNAPLGAVVQKAEVTVSKGTGTTKEDTDRVVKQGSQFEDTGDMWDQLKAWAGAPNTKTADEVLGIFYKMTPPQRNKVYMNNDSVLTAITNRTCKGGALTPEQVLIILNHCDFPLRWKIEEWYFKMKVIGKDKLIRRVIHNAPLYQRREAIVQQKVCEKLAEVFRGEHPENLFGDDMKNQYYATPDAKTAFWGSYPWYGKWCDREYKIDFESHWSALANFPGLVAKWKTSGLWKDHILKYTPRAAALTDTQIVSIDKLAYNGAVAMAEKLDLFQVRWNADYAKESGTLDWTNLKVVWDNLKKLPIGLVTSDMIARFVSFKGSAYYCPKVGCPREFTKVLAPGACPICGSGLELYGTRGSYQDAPNAGDYGDVKYGQISGGSSADLLGKFGHTVRHEVGHQTDTKLGGFANFVSKGPGFWKKYEGSGAWATSFVDYMGCAGDEKEAYKKLVVAYVKKDANFPNPLAGTHAKKARWDTVSTKYKSGSLADALAVAGMSHKANAATINTQATHAQKNSDSYPKGTPGFMGDRYFGKHYSEFYSYHKGCEAARAKAGHYCMSNPYDFYADLFANYFTKAAPHNNRKGDVPPWAAGYFKQVAEQFDRKAKQNPATYQKTLAEGNPGPEKH